MIRPLLYSLSLVWTLRHTLLMAPNLTDSTSTSNPLSYLPAPYVSSSGNGTVFSYHYYDPWMMVGFPPFARNINAKVKEWPNIFLQLRRKAVDLKMPGFLT